MGKSTVSRGVTEKKPCTKCGKKFYHYFGKGTKLITVCHVCDSRRI